MEKYDVIIPCDALLIVDCQNDFLPPEGALAVIDGDRIIPVLNQWIRSFEGKGLPVIATRDWHPKNHSSFKEFGGPWPAHCVQGTRGAEFPEGLHLSEEAIIVSKGTSPDRDEYSGFDRTGLKALLKKKGVKRLFIGGLATDYCVKATVLDALKLGFEVVVIKDAIKGVDVRPGDSKQAMKEMEEQGAVFI